MRLSLHKAAIFRNAFQNLLLHPETSARLSVQTPFGQFEPKFLPEGVAPASGVLMKVMSEIFADFSDWLIVIWDNILLCAMDYDEAFEKLKKVISRCKERNVYLKLSKSWFGFDHAQFFGDYCQAGSYRLTQDRIDSVKQIPFPTGSHKVTNRNLIESSLVSVRSHCNKYFDDPQATVCLICLTLFYQEPKIFHVSSICKYSLFIL